MDSRGSQRDDEQMMISAKIVIAGGFGVGKTTFVGSVSEVPPVNTEAWLTEAGVDIDPFDPRETKTTTTVAMDFGRITLHSDLMLYLFGTPGQPRFWFLWDDLSRGALGALILVDARHVEQSFPAIDYFENDSDVPFIVVINRFDGELAHDPDEVRDALALRPEIPLVTCDARERTSVARALRELVIYALSLTDRLDTVPTGAS